MGTHAVLMSCAVDASNPAAMALAGVLSAAFERHGRRLLPLPGLDANATRRLLARWFPGADAALGLDWDALAGADRTEPRADEIEEVVSLLREHADPAAGPKDNSDAIAWALACASLGDNHLWQDLDLPSRSELSALIGHWFPSLAARNTQNMKWKKFFYKQLCEREEILICKAPTCGVCTDHAVCFGPEDAQASQVIAFH
ncbi:MAG: nitrogen fixation protein NifQ [Burkholderiales bacterium]|nr:nitrogen fixation protein NifQ [Burkholderiales bacterium]